MSNSQLSSISSVKQLSFTPEARNKLLKLADGMKSRKKSSSATITTNNKSKKSSSTVLSHNKYDPTFTNIEHLVFGTYKQRPSTPISPSLDVTDSAHLINGQNNCNVKRTPNSESNSTSTLCECGAHSPESVSPNFFLNHVDSQSAINDRHINMLNNSFISDSNGTESIENEDMDIDIKSTIKSEHNLQSNEKPNMNSKSAQSINKSNHSFIPRIKSSTSQTSQSTMNATNCVKLTNVGSNDLVIHSHSFNAFLKGEKYENLMNDQINSAKLQKSSQIPKPHNSSPNDMQSAKLSKLIIEKRATETKTESMTSTSAHSQDMPAIESSLLFRNMSNNVSNNMSNMLSDSKFARIRSPLHANKRMPSLHSTYLRRHNSLDASRKSFTSSQTRFKQIKVLNDKSVSSQSRVKETRLSSLVYKSNTTFSSLTTNTIKSDMKSTASESKVIRNVSDTNVRHTMESKTDVLKSKSYGNLQRNRPQVKISTGSNRPTIKCRSNSVPDSKPFYCSERGVNRTASDSTANTTTDHYMQNDYKFKNIKSNFADKDFLSKNCDSNMYYNLRRPKIDDLFIMDEDNTPASPKKLIKTQTHLKNAFPMHSQNFSEKFIENFMENQKIRRQLFESSIKQFNCSVWPSIPSRPRSSSDFHLSSFISSDLRSDAINDEKLPPNVFNKLSRPWSHIYSESEAKRILKSTKSLGEVTDSLGNLHISSQQKSHELMNSEQKNNESKSSASTFSSTDYSSESVLQRFRKTFSLRFNRSAINQRIDSPIQHKLRSSVRRKSDENQVENYSTYNQSINDCIIEDVSNNKKIDYGCVDRNTNLNLMYTRDERSMRTHSNQLRRSLSHPHGIEKFNPVKNSRTNKSGQTSESETESESLSSNLNSNISRQSSEQQELDEDVVYAEALWDHFTIDAEELSFRAGEVIDISDSNDKDWWWGSITDNNGQRSGWFPASFVRTRVNQDDTLEECLNQIADGTLRKTPKKRLSISKLSNEQVRANVILEIINTERDFVRNLNDVIEGYLKPCRSNCDMFSDERNNTIFGNIEQLYQFQRSFLDQLERVMNWDHISSSLIGECFLKNESQFGIYSDYCNNHPLAVSDLQDLYCDQRYVHFFENCRLNQNMIDISLDGFLLTPIQKICKYPLQLGELLKYTRTDHEDYEWTKNAFAAMQRVAHLVNERKRRCERLQQLITIQQSMEGWNGTPLLDTCSVLIHSCDLYRLYPNRSREITLFLFDHLLICCKKDTGILKRGTYVYKYRIDMDSVSCIVDIQDGSRESDFGVVKNAFKFKVNSDDKEKWYYFQTKTSKDKSDWIKAFQEERQRILEDIEQGFVVTDKDKRGARMAYLNSLKPKKPRAKLAREAKSRRPDTAVAEIALEPTGFEIDRSRAGSLPSYIHPKFAVNTNANKSKQAPIKKKGSGWFNLGSGKKTKARTKRIKI